MPDSASPKSFKGTSSSVHKSPLSRPDGKSVSASSDDDTTTSQNPLLNKSVADVNGDGSVEESEEEVENSGPRRYGYEESDVESEEIEPDYDTLEDGPVLKEDEFANISKKDMGIPEHIKQQQDAGDTIVLLAALAGFVIAMAFCVVLPSMGVNSQLLMGAGMGAVILLIIWNAFVPSCSRKKDTEGEVSAGLVFTFAACLGCMMGAMIGGVLKNMKWEYFA